ncbi:CRASP family complement regulator-acquiring lipoprotein [Borrelia persica]|uniref:CRASP family complement regulator-acquiring lipoprotein n=1 Tax=Borrelia persica TaxID=44448 RepID=UPI000465CC0E|nr:CRASP family complement regulator-acquiring lipoprotein [Borrelia persica]
MKHKIFVILTSILTSLFLLACNQYNNQRVTNGTQQNPQEILLLENILSKLTPAIEQALKKHEDANWNEDGQEYNLKGQNQIFDIATYIKNGNQETQYNAADKTSKERRRKVYLAFEYNTEYLKAFEAFTNRMQAAGNIALYDDKVKESYSGTLAQITEYAQTCYIDIFQSLKNKRDKIKDLSPTDLINLQTNLNEVTQAMANIQDIVTVIKNDYNNDIKIGVNKDKAIKSQANFMELADYLYCNRISLEDNFSKIKKTAPTVIHILNKTT